MLIVDGDIDSKQAYLTWSDESLNYMKNMFHIEPLTDRIFQKHGLRLTAEGDYVDLTVE